MSTETQPIANSKPAKIKQVKKTQAQPPPPSCDICCENLNKSSRKPLICSYCDKGCCLTCQKMYISSSISDPHCMFCKIAWNNAFLRANFPSAWLSKEYRTIREQMLFDAEVAKIPHTQRFCDAARDKDAIIAEKEELCKTIKNTKSEITNTQTAYDKCNQDIWMFSGDKNAIDQVEQLKITSHTLHLKSRVLQDTIECLNEQFEKLASKEKNFTSLIEGDDPVRKDDTWNLPCPSDKCRGFVGKNWKCGLCSKRICPECHEVKAITIDQIEHQCVPETKESIKMLQNDSKPCPKCGSMIHKISGCDQMWCTQCRTAFSWKTGNIEEKVHNPHYYEWVRTQNVARPAGIQPEADPQDLDICGRFIGENNTWKIIQKIRDQIELPEKREFIHNLVRLLIHIENVELVNMIPFYIRQIPHDPNRDIRIKYMLESISQEEFRSILQRREKDRLKRENISQIYTTFLDVSDDLLKRLLLQDMPLDQFNQQIEEIRQFTNESLVTVSEQYGVKVKCITPDFTDIVTLEKIKIEPENAIDAT